MGSPGTLPAPALVLHQPVFHCPGVQHRFCLQGTRRTKPCECLSPRQTPVQIRTPTDYDDDDDDDDDDGSDDDGHDGDDDDDAGKEAKNLMMAVMLMPLLRSIVMPMMTMQTLLILSLMMAIFCC